MSDPQPADIRVNFQLSFRELYRATVAMTIANFGKFRVVFWISLVLALLSEVAKVRATGSVESAAANFLPLFLIVPFAAVVGCCLAP